MSAPGKTRKKRDTSRKHALILDHAIHVFTAKGYESTSMDEIAEAAGGSKKTIYNHFQSKENLFQEIVANFLRERDSIKPISYSADDSLESQLRKFALAEIYLIDNPRRRGISKLLTTVFLLDQNFGKETRGRHNPYGNFYEWLARAQTDGRIRCESPELATRMFYGLVEGCITWGALMSDGENLTRADVLLDEIIALFLSRYGRD